jgi:hypothetical protein
LKSTIFAFGIAVAPNSIIFFIFADDVEIAIVKQFAVAIHAFYRCMKHLFSPLLSMYRMIRWHTQAQNVVQYQ